MNWLRKTLSVLGASVLCGLVAPACEDNESMLFVIGVLAIETTNCVAKPESGATMHFSGVLDVSLGTGYSAAVMVGSQLTQRGSRDQLRTETARIRLEGAEVTLTNSEGALLNLTHNPFSVVGTGIVDPTAATDPGLGAISVDAIPASVSSAVVSQVGGNGIVIAKMRIFGTTLGGQEIESGEYSYPIQVCSGCLVSYSDLTPNPLTGEPECVGPGSASEATICQFGQDQPVPCTSCNAFEVCLNPCTNCAVRAGDAAGSTNSVCTVTMKPASCP